MLSRIIYWICINDPFIPSSDTFCCACEDVFQKVMHLQHRTSSTIQYSGSGRLPSLGGKQSSCSTTYAMTSAIRSRHVAVFSGLLSWAAIIRHAATFACPSSRGTVTVGAGLGCQNNRRTVPSCTAFACQSTRGTRAFVR